MTGNREECRLRVMDGVIQLPDRRRVHSLEYNGQQETLGVLDTASLEWDGVAE